MKLIKGIFFSLAMTSLAHAQTEAPLVVNGTAPRYEKLFIGKITAYMATLSLPLRLGVKCSFDEVLKLERKRVDLRMKFPADSKTVLKKWSESLERSAPADKVAEFNKKLERLSAHFAGSVKPGDQISFLFFKNRMELQVNGRSVSPEGGEPIAGPTDEFARTVLGFWLLHPPPGNEDLPAKLLNCPGTDEAPPEAPSNH